MGPFNDNAAKALSLLEDDMRCNLPGFEGQFFDPNDVEGYLRGRGLDIAPAAEYVRGEVDFDVLVEISSPKSQSSDSIDSIISPRTPNSPVTNTNVPLSLNADPLSDMDFFPDTTTTSKSDSQTLPFPLGFAEWNTDTASGSIFIDPQLTSMMSEPMQDLRYSESATRTVTINVTTLLDGKCFCLMKLLADHKAY